jgi:hypothetical protein
MDRPKDADVLWGMIAKKFGVGLPREVFTPGHSSPFAFVADCFFHPGDDVAVWACRNGLKTLSASILAALEARFIPGLQVRVLSGSEDQARNLYRYWQRWCGGFLKPHLDGPVRAEVTCLKGGGRLEILAASHKRVRGPKVHRLYEDELDEIDPEIDEAAAGMLASHSDIPACTRYMSTWHRANGPMRRLVDGSPGNGVRVHKWNVWEVIARCPPSRHRWGAGCRECPLREPCLAKAREYHSRPEPGPIPPRTLDGKLVELPS